MARILALYAENRKRASQISYSDAYVLDLIRRGYTKEQVTKRYLQLDVHKHIDLEDVYKKNIAYLDSAHNTRDFRITDYIVDNFTKRELFFSYNHPHKDILLLVANEILNIMGLQPLDPKDAESLPSLGEDFQMPIHPAIADFFRLEFYTLETTVHQYGEQVNFSRYLENYVDSKMLPTTRRDDYKKGSFLI